MPNLTLDELVLETPSWGELTKDDLHDVAAHCFGSVATTAARVNTGAINRHLNDNPAHGEKLDAAVVAENAKAIRLEKMLADKTGGSIEVAAWVAFVGDLPLAASEKNGLIALADSNQTRMKANSLTNSRREVLRRAVELKEAE